MGKLTSIAVLLVLGAVLMARDTVHAANGLLPADGLVRQYYKHHTTCVNAEAIITSQVGYYMKKDKSIAPKLARLLYSDCFVTGCDASILLLGKDSERMAPQNLGLGGFVVIDKIKQALELTTNCTNVVSCADILALATRDAISQAGGPSAIIRTGRKDGMSSKASNVDLPSANISIDKLLQLAESKGLDLADMTALLGLHSMGSVRCRYIMDRLYNYNGSGKSDPRMDAATLAALKAQCPEKKKKGDHEGIVAMNPDAPKYTLSNTTFTRILNYKAVMGVDQQLMDNDDTKDATQEFSDTFQDFKLSLALGLAKMTEIGVLTGTQGQVRKSCGYVN